MPDYRRVIQVFCKKTKKKVFIKEDGFHPDHFKLIKGAPAPVSLNSFTRSLEAQKAERSKSTPPEHLLAAQKEMEENAAQSGDFVPKADNPNPDAQVPKERTNQPADIGDEEANEAAKGMMSDPMPSNILSARKWAKKKGMKDVTKDTTMEQMKEFAKEKGLA